MGDGGEGCPRGANLNLFLSLSLFFEGDSYPKTCAQRTAEGGGSLLSFVVVGGEANDRFPLSFLSYIFLGDERESINK